MGLPGIWIGKTVLEWYIMITYVLLVYYTDWEAAAKEAVEQNKKLDEASESKVKSVNDRKTKDGVTLA